MSDKLDEFADKAKEKAGDLMGGDREAEAEDRVDQAEDEAKEGAEELKDKI